MAEKEAIVYIVDVGKSMGTKNHGRKQSDLDWAMIYVWDTITNIMALDRKTTLQALVGLKTDGTTNELSDDESFHNISVFQELSQILLPDLKRLQKQVKPSKTDNGDAISAIVIAIQLILKTCKKLKYKRKIVLVTDGRGQLDTDQVSEITSKIVEDGISLVVIGVDFDDDEYHFKEEQKPRDKLKNEALLKSLTEDCGGLFGTLAQAIEELGEPRPKTTRPVPSFKGQLTLGKPGLDTSLSIDVERYPRIMVRKPQSARIVPQPKPQGDDKASSVTVAGSSGEAGPSASDPDSTGNQDSEEKKSVRKYEVVDEDSEGGRRLVALEDLSKGYEYGRTAVYIDESDRNVTIFSTKAGLEIIGFIKWSNYERYMSLSTTSVIVAARSNTLATLALSSFIHALIKEENYAVARLVTKDDKPPVLVILAPSIEDDVECLIDVQIPFAEDVRSYQFAPLDRVETVSGKVLKEHRNLPNDALLSAMSDYVDAMDLTNFGEDGEGNPTEYMAIRDVYSPILHRVDQGIRWRAIHPTEPIPPPYEILTKYSKPPADLLASSEKQLKKLTAAAGVKKVPEKAIGRRKDRKRAAPRSGIDLDGILDKHGALPTDASFQINPRNAVPEFKRILQNPPSDDTIAVAAAQMGAIAEKFVSDSLGDMNYPRVIEIMRVFREEMADLEAEGMWNEWLRGFKDKLLGGKLEGDRREMWWEVRKIRLGLLVAKDEEERRRNKVTEEEGWEFLGSR